MSLKTINPPPHSWLMDLLAILARGHERRRRRADDKKWELYKYAPKQARPSPTSWWWWCLGHRHRSRRRCNADRPIIIALALLALASLFWSDEIVCGGGGLTTLGGGGGRSRLCSRQTRLWWWPRRSSADGGHHHHPRPLRCLLGGNITATLGDALGLDADRAGAQICACVPPLQASKGVTGASLTASSTPCAEILGADKRPAVGDGPGANGPTAPRASIRVAAVVPFYNGDGNPENERMLAECVDSLKNQTVPWLTDVFVVIDGGNGGAVATSDLSGDKGNVSVVAVHTIKTPHKGLPHARNAGLRATRSLQSTSSSFTAFDYILLLDGDDVAHPRTVELLAKSAEATSADLAWGDIHFFGDENLVWQTQEFNPYDLMWANHPATMALVRLNVFFDRFGLYDESMTRGMEDWAFWARIAAMGAKGVRVPLPLFHYRRHGATLGVTMLAEREQRTRDVLRSNFFKVYASPEKLRELKRSHRLLLSVIVTSTTSGGDDDDDKGCGSSGSAAVDLAQEMNAAQATIRSLAKQSLEDFELVVVMNRRCDGVGNKDVDVAINPWLEAIRRACQDDDQATSSSSTTSSSSSSCSFPLRTVTRKASSVDRTVVAASSSSSPRNYGALHAHGDLVTFLQPGDVLLDPLALEKLALALTAQKDASIAAAYSSSSSNSNSNSSFDGGATTGGVANSPGTWDPARLVLLQDNYIGNVFLVRKDAFLEVGGMDPACKGCQDHDFWLRFVQHGYAGAYVNESLYQARSRSTAVVDDEQQRRQLLNARNPVLYGSSCSQGPLEHYRALNQADFGNDVADDKDLRIVRCIVRQYNDDERSRARKNNHRGDDDNNDDDNAATNPADLRSVLSDAAVSKLPRAHYRRPQHPFVYNVARYGSTTSAATKTSSLIYMVPHMAVGGAEIVDLNILQGLRQGQGRGGRHHHDHPLHITLVVETGNRTELAAKFSQVCDEVFVLDRLPVPLRRLPELLDYFIVSRNAAVVFNRNSMFAYRSSKRWRRKFPQLKQVDLLHLYEVPHGGWERESAPFHGNYDARFVVSDSLRQHMQDKYGLPAKDFIVIPNGLDYSAYDGVAAAAVPPTTTIQGQADGKDGGTTAPITIGLVGRFEPQKRPLLWVRMAAALKQLLPHPEKVRFVMIGTGSQESAVRGLAKMLLLDEDEDEQEHEDAVGSSSNTPKAPVVEFHPQPTPELFASLSALVLTSAFEGVPLVMLEAAAAGVPTIAPDVGGIREVADELLGQVFPADASAGAIAASVVEFLEQENKRRQHDGDDRAMRRQQQVRKTFGLEAMQEAYGAQIARLLATREKDRALEDYLYYLMDAPLFAA